MKNKILYLLFSLILFISIMNLTSAWNFEQSTATTSNTHITLINNDTELYHNNLSGLQGGVADQYYHIRKSWYDDLLVDIFNYITEAEADVKYTPIDEPKWTANLTANNLAWLNTTNLSYLLIDKYNSTNSSYLTIWNDTIMHFGDFNVTNTSYMLIDNWNATNTSYYLASNPNAYWNTTFATFNKTYADTLYFGVGNWNATNESYLTIWNNTIMHFGDFNVTNTSYRTLINGTFANLDLNTTGVVNASAFCTNGNCYTTTNLLNTTNLSYLLIDKFNVTNTSYLMIDRWNATNTTYREKYNLTWVGNFNSTSNVTLGTNRFFLNDVTGNVGIGTTSPGYKLDVSGTGVLARFTAGANDNVAILGHSSFADGGTIGAYNSALDVYKSLEFKASVFTFTNGNVGIGTVAPNNTLHVVGTINASQMLINNTAVMRIDQWNATNNSYLKDYGDTATGNYTFDSGTLFIGSTTDRVGIGTSAPNAVLDVFGGTTSDIFIVRTFPSTIGTGAGISMTAGLGFDAFSGGSINITAGNSGIQDGEGNVSFGGNINLIAGTSGYTDYFNGNIGGNITLTAGNGGGTGAYSITGGKGGNVIIKGGNSGESGADASPDSDGGDIIIDGGEPAYLGKHGNILLNARTEGITAEGNYNVGIGTKTPKNRLNVIGTLNVTNRTKDIQGLNVDSQNRVLIGSATALFRNNYLVVGSNSTMQSIFPSTNNTYSLGNTTLTWENVFARTYTTTSSEKFKENISGITNALDKVNQINGVYFNWKDDGTRSVGFIAEDLAKVFPEAVYYNDGQPEGIDYGKITSLLLEGIKEQQIIIEEQNKTIILMQKSLCDLGAKEWC